VAALVRRGLASLDTTSRHPKAFATVAGVRWLRKEESL
jgi:hypothetical protein